MKEFLKAIFYDINGKPSSKRIFGALSFILASVIVFVTREAELVWPFLAMSGGLFGFSIGEKVKGQNE